MKSIIAVLCLVLAVSAFTDQWNAWKAEHGKVYLTELEETQRFQVFSDNLKIIDSLNAASKAARFGTTHFADLTPREFEELYLSSTPAVRDPTVPVADEYDEDVLAALPDSFDWRTKGAVTPVKNQGQCGSCWAFSTTGNVEGQWFLAGNTLTGLSEQNLVDCDHECMTYDGSQSCDSGCQGGLQPNAFRYIMSNGGIDTESSYPYQAVDGTCSFNSANIGAKITNYTMVSTNETQIAAYLVANGPLSIAVDAAPWQFYVGGVYDLPCGSSLDHGVLIVGFGNQKNIIGHDVDYWLIKNSWGGSWGESGYIKLERGDGKCGCNQFVSSSII